MTIEIRQALDIDMRFIHSSWFTSYWKNCAHALVSREIYKIEQDKIIDALLPRSQIRVAFFPEVSDEILGYVVQQGETIHWVYTKNIYRKQGIATLLIERPVKYFSHYTEAPGRRFLSKFGATYNPFLWLGL